MIAQLDGTSPAFIRELLRRAALLAAEENDGPLHVSDRHLHEALAELRQAGGELTRTLLGAQTRSPDDATDDEPDQDD